MCESDDVKLWLCRVLIIGKQGIVHVNQGVLLWLMQLQPRFVI